MAEQPVSELRRKCVFWRQEKKKQTNNFVSETANLNSVALSDLTKSNKQESLGWLVKFEFQINNDHIFKYKYVPCNIWCPIFMWQPYKSDFIQFSLLYRF